MINFRIAKTWSWPISSNLYFLLLIDRTFFETYQKL